jgi:cytochrome d ubiquinol oxidase subunit I
MRRWGHFLFHDYRRLWIAVGDRWSGPCNFDRARHHEARSERQRSIMTLDAAILARVQFAFTVSFHIIFPTISIGLAMFLTVMEGLWLKTKDAIYLEIYRFWLSIFAMAFGVGVVTGLVLSFEFGLGFARFAQIAGPAIGPIIALEVLTSFFLEAGFLGIMLFGFHRVGPKLHFVATLMVALGTTMSASWILAANSWMQTPDGVVLIGGRMVVTGGESHH